MREIKKIIIHCSDSPDHMDIGANEIRVWHTQRGFEGPDGILGTKDDLAYHFICRRDGLIEIGRMEDQVGAHCFHHNDDSLGICWIGRDWISGEQKKALKLLCKSLLNRYGLTVDDIRGHCEFDAGKTCPNFNQFNAFKSMDDFRNFMRKD
jgi:N-acetylmuramoyl-L-alanine amidase